MIVKGNKAKLFVCITLSLLTAFCIGCTSNANNNRQSEAMSPEETVSIVSQESIITEPASADSTSTESFASESTETNSTVSIPTSKFPDWSTWTRPVERHDLISYDELLAKMPAITPNADASRFTAEDAVAAGVRDGDTFNSIKKKLGDPVAIYDDRGVLGLMRYYLYDGVYFSIFKEISEDGGETYEKFRNGDIVMSAVIFGEGIEGPRGIKIGDTFESVMAMYPQDKNYLENEMFYGKYAFSGPSGIVYVSDITGFNDPFGESEGPGCPVEIVLIPDDYRPAVKLFFDDNLTLREMRIYYEVFPFG